MRNTYRRGNFTVSQLSEPEEVQQLLSVYSAIGEREGWETGDDLMAFTPFSVHWGIFDNSLLLGGLRLTLDSPLGLPYEKVWPDFSHLKRGLSADIALLAISRPCGSSFWLCCVEMVRFCEEVGIEHLFAEVPPRRLATYQRMGWGLRPVGPVRKHWGEDCHLCVTTPEEALSGLYSLPPMRRKTAVDQYERPRAASA